MNVLVIQLWSDDVETDKVLSGDNVKLKLKGVEDTDILPGFVICSPDSLCRVGRVFDAEVFSISFFILKKSFFVYNSKFAYRCLYQNTSQLSPLDIPVFFIYNQLWKR